nr:immunoglobulin light chain junction region [Macaca mulatta]MOX80048.1 immunoglobulin light chain junction region [Macaca mulatta]MOX82336.1 immunoglobulin light chain junction region [Macaca mulatta]MOX82529.1 immunoglobulin light chain junction region [Macaca mulatta]MOX83446.1 immunoglobulin light chain junction region [Macaca mulatta]
DYYCDSWDTGGTRGLF